MRAGVACPVAALALLAAGCGGDDPPALPEGRFLAVSKSIEPRVQLFGDTVVARIDLIVDRERYDPARIRVTPAFAPYELEGEPTRDRRDLGRFAHLRYAFTLRCVTFECLETVGGGPPQVQPGGLPSTNQGGGFGERKSIRLEAARVLYDDAEKGAQLVRRVSWPELQSVSRLNFADTDVIGIGFPFEASVTPLREASYRFSPTTLGAAFVAGALALLALAAALLAGLLRREPPPVVEEESELTPLEHALHQVETARERPEADRRGSLEALAAQLDEETPGRAADTRALAWSPVAPSSEAMDELVESVRGADAATA